MTSTVRTGALVAALALAATAHAQSNAPYTYALQGGTVGYRSTGVRDLIGKSGTFISVRRFASGLEPQLSPDYGVPSFELDYTNGSRDGSSARCIGLSVVERVPFGRPDSDERAARLPYLGVGIGIGQSQIKQKVRIQNGGEVAFKTNSQTNMGLYYKAVVGYHFTSKIFVEAGYLGFPKALSFQPGALMTSVGVKF